MKLSVVVITFNEEKNLSRCLASVKEVADEIVVVDSYSTDGTKAIAESFGARFIQNRFEGHIQQKNFAMNAANFDHVLSLDADESLDETLIVSVKKAKAVGHADGYQMNRLNNYCGTFIRHGNWYPDRKLRLWDRRKGKWGGENPHDQVIMEKGSKVERLHGDILHYTYHTPTDHFAQMNKFSDIAASEAYKKGKKTSIMIHLILNPIVTFLKSYVIRLGFLDGYAGFQVAVHGAYYRFLKYSKLKHLHARKNQER
jgi:glycosyltransferase involved in cell wall biosynthesis